MANILNQNCKHSGSLKMAFVKQVNCENSFSKNSKNEEDWGKEMNKGIKERANKARIKSIGRKESEGSKRGRKNWIEKLRN